MSTHALPVPARDLDGHPSEESSDQRWAAVRALHWHDCVPSAETRARAARHRVA